jgi:hypothetical protein
MAGHKNMASQDDAQEIQIWRARNYHTANCSNNLYSNEIGNIKMR